MQEDDLMSNVKVSRLVYADFHSTNVDGMVDYYVNVMGYSITEEKDGIFYLSNCLDHHNIVITPGEENAVKSLGYQLNRKQTIEEVYEELQSKGIVAKVLKNTKPGIAELIELQDPDGIVIELFNDITLSKNGYSSSGIVPLKLGHIAFCAINHQEVVDFYQDVLGFHFTDKIGENFCNFLTCNMDHHVLNIVASDQSKLHHIAFQLKDASHQNASSDLLQKFNHPVIWGPSRHTAGHNIATYHYDPDGHVIELYTDMDVFLPELGIFEPRPWHKELPLKPKVWNSLSSWGTEFQMDLSKI